MEQSNILLLLESCTPQRKVGIQKGNNLVAVYLVPWIFIYSLRQYDYPPAFFSTFLVFFPLQLYSSLEIVQWFFSRKNPEVSLTGPGETFLPYHEKIKT